MLPSKRHFNQLLGHYGCYVVLSISSNLEDTLDATFEQSFHSISRMLWMLRGNIHFKQLLLVPRLNPKGLSNIWNRETSQHMPPCPPLNPSPPKCPLVPRLNPKGLSNIWNRETSQHMPPGPPLNPSPPKCPLVPRLNPKGLSNIWNRETSQHMPPCPPLNPSPPKSPLVPRLNPKGLSNIFKLLLFRGECDPFWFRGECDPLLGANVTPVPVVILRTIFWVYDNIIYLHINHINQSWYIIYHDMLIGIV